MRLSFSHGPRPTPPAAPAPAEPPRIDLVARALELANDDWTEQEAAEELVRVAEGDRGHLLAAYETLVAQLIRTTVFDRRRVRATRVVSRSTRLVSPNP